VPKKGAWYTCAFVCIVGFFLNLDKLSKIISMGTLLSYSFVNAGVIALRFREERFQEEDSYGLKVAVKSKNELYAWIFVALSFLFAMSIGHQWDTPLIYILGALTLGSFLFLYRIP